MTRNRRYEPPRGLAVASTILSMTLVLMLLGSCVAIVERPRPEIVQPAAIPDQPGRYFYGPMGYDRNGRPLWGRGS